MDDGARNLDGSLPPGSGPRFSSDEEAVVLSREDSEELEQAIADAHEDLRAGRCITFDDLRAKLRAA